MMTKITAPIIIFLFMLILPEHRASATAPGILINTERNGKVAEDLFYTLDIIERDKGPLGRFVQIIQSPQKKLAIFFSEPKKEWLRCENIDNHYACSVKTFSLSGDRQSAAYALYLAMRYMLVNKQTLNRSVAIEEHSHSYFYMHSNVKQEFNCRREKSREMYQCSFASLP
jgi:hypothetical protein